MVYLPMSYVYACRASAPDCELTRAIRTELYPVDYATIDWNAARNLIAKEDLYYPHPLVQVRGGWWRLTQRRACRGERMCGVECAVCDGVLCAIV